MTQGEDVLMPGDWTTVIPQKPTAREVYIAYLRMKVDEEDWHAVSDGANDLRVLDAREQVRQVRCDLDPKYMAQRVAEILKAMDGVKP